MCSCVVSIFRYMRFNLFILFPGEQVTDKMLRDKAGEISTLPDFRPTKSWVLAWKEKYNVSLENQTYGTAGETEGEIVEESQVYDEVTIQVCLCEHLCAIL